MGFPSIVDPKQVAEKIYGRAFWLRGHFYIGVKRVCVYEDIDNPVVEELRRIAEAGKMENGADPDTVMGLLNSNHTLKRVIELAGDAEKSGVQSPTAASNFRVVDITSLRR